MVFLPLSQFRILFVESPNDGGMKGVWGVEVESTSFQYLELLSHSVK